MPPRLVVYGIEGKTFDIGAELSAEVPGRFPTCSGACDRNFRRSRAALEWSHIAPEHLRAQFAYARQGTLYAGARLEIDVRPETDTARAQEVRLDQIAVGA